VGFAIFVLYPISILVSNWNMLLVTLRMVLHQYRSCSCRIHKPLQFNAVTIKPRQASILRQEKPRTYCDLVLMYQQTRRLRMSGPVPPFLLFVFMGCAGENWRERTSPWRHARLKYVLTTDTRQTWQPMKMQPTRNVTHKRSSVTQSLS